MDVDRAVQVEAPTRVQLVRGQVLRAWSCVWRLFVMAREQLLARDLLDRQACLFPGLDARELALPAAVPSLAHEAQGRLGYVWEVLPVAVLRVNGTKRGAPLSDVLRRDGALAPFVRRFVRGHPMTEGDPTALPALFLDHLRAGVDALEGCTLDLEDRVELSRLALRLIRLSRKDSE